MAQGRKKRTRRSGVVTGVRIANLLRSEKLLIPSAGAMAAELGMEESYVRRICRTLVDEGLLESEERPQRGTPPVNVFSIIEPE